MELLPLPPPEMRALVGRVDPAAFDNPSGGDAIPDVGERCRKAVFDFGCGCGRIARQLIQQRVQPESYLGIDLHHGMIAWCQANLTPRASQFRFVHHDVGNVGFNPGPSKPDVQNLPAEESSFDLVLALSVFTHIVESAALHYLRECRRILRPEGMLRSTWFLCDKRDFPMMQDFQNALYINAADPTNAVVYDRKWLIAALEECGLVITRAEPPEIRGFHWYLTIEAARPGITRIEIPEDSAPYGSMPPPVLVAPPATIGQELLT